jgi:hypothetical protein
MNSNTARCDCSKTRNILSTTFLRNEPQKYGKILLKDFEKSAHMSRCVGAGVGKYVHSGSMDPKQAAGVSSELS